MPPQTARAPEPAPSPDAVADALLAGPRGRRLCLQLALAADDRLARAVAAAALSLEAPGTAGVTAVSGMPLAYREGSARGTELPADGAWMPFLPSLAPSPRFPRQPRPDPVGVAAAIERLRSSTFHAPGDDALVQATAHAVAVARYWQEPDGEDRFAAIPEVVEALRPLARLVATTVATGWWAAPFAPEGQHVVAYARWDDPTGPPRPDPVRPARAVVDEWYAEATEAEERARRSPAFANPEAHVSGEWWSLPVLAVRTTSVIGDRGPAALWFEEDSSDPERAQSRAVTVRRGARVLEIDGPRAWADLCRRYPLDVTASRRHDWYRTTGRRDGRWCVPDWRAVSRDVDGVHLSALGYLTTAGRAVPVHPGREGHDAATVLAGWDAGATVWLSDAVEPVGASVAWSGGCDADGSWTWRRA